uniref:Uncharacterized protein n=1 Tax=Physcomitrium patens TaxID=3218 RepID=A0A2K1IGQ0_PHYPA|nr:hypothetical protein PHYPA_029049 [Physcomitrium patens]
MVLVDTLTTGFDMVLVDTLTTGFDMLFLWQLCRFSLMKGNRFSNQQSGVVVIWVL